jgi:hypothetical protein
MNGQIARHIVAQKCNGVILVNVWGWDRVVHVNMKDDLLLDKDIAFVWQASISVAFYTNTHFVRRFLARPPLSWGPGKFFSPDPEPPILYAFV